MKTREWKIESGGWETRSVLECGSPLPLLNRGQCVAMPQNASMLAQCKTWRQVVVALFCLFILPYAFCLEASAQSYSIDWYKIAGGGDTSTGGIYAVSGTIGQHDAGGPMTGGSYSVTGGFWVLISVLQTPGAPALYISHSGNSVTVYWQAVAGWTNLEQNAVQANTGNWVTSGYTITTANGTNRITITPPTGKLFFRLRGP